MKRQATTATSFGLEMHLLDAKEAQDLWPLMQVDDVVGAAFLPTDGQASPVRHRHVAGQGRAQCRRHDLSKGVAVTGIEVEDGRVRAVVTDEGRIACDKLVICAGQWSREIGRMAGVNIPLVSVQHQYLITEPIDGVTREPADAARSRPAHLLQGGGRRPGDGRLRAEPEALGRATAFPTTSSSSFSTTTGSISSRCIELAAGRVPALQTAGIKQLINGPESFTPDGNFILGEAPEVRGVFVGAGFNAFGIASGGGAGMALAEWVAKGEPPFDLWPVDIRRFGRNHLDTDWVRTRTLEAYAKHYTMAWPFEEYRSRPPAPPLAALRQAESARRLLRREARLGAAELVRRSARGEKAEDRLQLRAAELVRRRRPRAPGVPRARRACSTRPPSPSSCWSAATPRRRSRGSAPTTSPSRRAASTYTQMLNERGGIECDLTVARLSPTEYLHRHRHRLRHARLRLDLALDPRRARCQPDRRHLVAMPCCR